MPNLRRDSLSTFRVRLAIAAWLAIGIVPGCGSEKPVPVSSSGSGVSTSTAVKSNAPTATGQTPTPNVGAESPVPTPTAVSSTTTAVAQLPTPTKTSAPPRPVETTKQDPPKNEDKKDEKLPAVKPGEPVPLNKQLTVWLDGPGKKVVLKAHVALREGPLELLCCKKQTKEHESIFSVDTQAFVVQTALLALGAKTGGPARYEPTYQPATGEKIEIFVSWTDAQGKPQRRRAREMVRYLSQKFYTAKFARLPKGIKLPEPSELRYDSVTQELSWYGSMRVDQKDSFLDLTTDAEFRKAIQKFFDDSRPREMSADFVFVGSGFQKRPDGKDVFLAEDGDLICVANFSNAVIDVNLKSSSVNETLLFEAYTERIPPKGTPVTLELIPVPAEPSPKK